ncbi:MAG: helix-turn-helix transcriptional regulator [Clostridia bacterium]|nr:helix-turn-helix transcriptional regulator [Clostridia bacterium]
MKDIKPIIAKNLSALRKRDGLTQAELAEKLNYSDKAISRWERGDTLPDINVLYQICEFYGIDMNTLVSDDVEEITEDREMQKRNKIYKFCLLAMMLAVVWLITTILFLYSGKWVVFVWAVPVSSTVLMIISRKLIVSNIVTLVNSSVFIWGLLTSAFLSFLVYGHIVVWALFLIGLPLQFIVTMRFVLRRVKPSKE